MIDWGKNYSWKRYNRKKRQWGRHGKTLNDRIRWSVNQAVRTIAGHYYYGMTEHTERKWRALSGRGWGK